MAKPTIEQLRERVRGAVIGPDEEGYEEARQVYNAMIDRRPGVVVRPANAGDVMAAVDFARENGLDLAVRGGSHGVPGFGTCDDGVVVDLSGMRGVRVDPAKRTARAEGGATWGDFNAATYPLASLRLAASSPPPVSPGSLSVAASATLTARSGCPATTWSRPTS
jgi:FAD/FMN-containing dehydrogenase